MELILSSFIIVLMGAAIFLVKTIRLKGKQSTNTVSESHDNAPHSDSNMLGTGLAIGSGMLAYEMLHERNSHDDTDIDDHCSSINPASGLPMLNCIIDIEGNIYGTSSSDDDWHTGWDDAWSSSSSFSDD